MQRVLITGTFDILHPGHGRFLKEAAKKGGRLYIVVARDATVKRLKGYPPFFSEAERIQNLKKLGIAYRVLLGNLGDKFKIVESVKPDIICLGYDQHAFTQHLDAELKKRGLNTRITRLKKYRMGTFNTQGLHQAGLVSIQNADPTILTDPRYATRRNFLKKPLYRNAIILTRKNIAAQLKRVQKNLNRRGLCLKIWDSYRPLAVQKQMWKARPDERYIGNPKKKPFHTRAAAVDCTLVDLKTGRQLDMPTPFDTFSRRAHRDYPKHTRTQRKNMLLLERAMVREGLDPFPTEWWHFTDPKWQSYPVLDIAI